MRMLLRLATVLITLSPCVIICRCLPFEWHTFKRFFFLFSKRLDERWLCTIKPIVRYACDHENIRNLQVNNNMKRTSLHNINTEAHKYRRAHTHTHTETQMQAHVCISIGPTCDHCLAIAEDCSSEMMYEREKNSIFILYFLLWACKQKQTTIWTYIK